MIRFISYIKGLGITMVLTELLPDISKDYSDLAISSLVDTWFRLRQVESNGELNRLLNVVKARGSRTSNQVKEFAIDDHGIRIEDPYIGEGELVIGSAKASRIEQEQEAVERKRYELTEVEQSLSTLEAAYDSKTKTLGAEFERERRGLMRKIEELKRQAEQVADQREVMKDIRD